MTTETDLTQLPSGDVDHLIAAQAAEIEALRKEVERLKSMTAVTMGVGSGDGNLFVHGDYESIKAAQAIVLERDALRAEVDALQAEVEKLRAEVAEWKSAAAAQAELHDEAEDRPAVELHDNKDGQCEKCKKGRYIETSVYSDLEGWLECSHCSYRVDRYVPR